MSITEAKRYIRRLCLPSCLVLSTPKAMDLVTTNNLTPAELFRPFGDLRKENVTLQLTEKSIHTMREIQFQFYDRIAFFAVNENDKINLRTNALVNNSPHFDFSQTETKVHYISQDPTQWFTKWKNTYRQLINFPNQELLQQPVAIFLVLSSSDSDLVESSRKLSQSLPPQYGNLYDSSGQIPRIILVLHRKDWPMSYLNEKLEPLRKKYMAFHVQPVTFNSLHDAPDEEMRDIWTEYLDHFRYIQNPLIDSNRGIYLSPQDRSGIREVISESLRKRVIPMIEKKMRTLNGTIINTRKGFKNTLKGMFRTNKERTENSGLSGSYKMSPREREMREAADLSFILQDYETAYNHYKIAQRDFESIKANAYAGSCIEMKTLCAVMLDKTKKDFEKQMSVSNHLYEKARNGQMQIRNTLLTTHVLVLMGRYMDAANFYLKMGGMCKKNSELPALFIEQASICFGRQQSRCKRKYAMYQIVAGNMYLEVGLHKFSINCYGNAFRFYENSKWPTILIQIYSHLGKTLGQISDLNCSLQFYRKLLEVAFTAQSEGIHNSYLTAFLNTAKSLLKTSSGLNPFELKDDPAARLDLGFLRLPEMDENSVELQLFSDEYATNISDSKELAKYEDYFNNNPFYPYYKGEDLLGMQNKDLKWHQMGLLIDNYIKTGINDPFTKYDRFDRSHIKYYDIVTKGEKRMAFHSLNRFAYAGEPILVRFRLKNPLKTLLNVGNMKLIAQYSDENSTKEEENEDKEGLAKDVPAPDTPQTTTTSDTLTSTIDETPSSLVIEEVNLKLSPEEWIEVCLRVTPQREGKIVISGIQWEMGGVVKCSYTFRAKDASDTDSLTSFANPTPQFRPIIHRIELGIKKCTGCLKVRLEDPLKQNFVQGECDSFGLILSNIGSEPISRIAIATNYPIMMAFKYKYITLPLNPDKSIRIPCYFWAAQKGTMKVNFLLRYEVRDPITDESICYRFSRIQQFLEIGDSFKLRALINPSYRKTDEYMLSMQMNSERHQSKYQKEIYLSELGVVGSTWVIQEKEHPHLEGFDQISNKFFSVIKSSVESTRVGDYEGGYRSNIQISGSPTGGLPGDLLGGKEMKLELGEEPYLSLIVEERERGGGSGTNSTNSMNIRDQGNGNNINNINNIDLVITWRLTRAGKTVQGMHILLNRPMLLTITKTPTNIMSILNMCPLQIVHDCPSLVKHHFTHNPICLVKLKLHIKSKNTNFRSSFRLKVVKAKKYASGICWVGVTDQNIVDMEPGEEEEIGLTACFTKYGVYDLNQFQFLFYRNKETGEDMDPGRLNNTNYILKKFNLNRDQIFVHVLPP